MKYVVELRSVGNPDHGQDPGRPMWGVDEQYPECETIAAAQGLVLAWIETNRVGGGNFIPARLLCCAGKKWKVVGWFSYNGRLWADMKCTGEIIL